MLTSKNDALLRLIAQTAAMLAKLRSSLNDDTGPTQVIAEVDRMMSELLGPERALLDRLDALSAKQIVGNPDKIKAWSDLLHLKADAETRLGNRASAEHLHTRANALSPNTQSNNQ